MKNFQLRPESLAATGSKATKEKQKICDGCRSEIADEEAYTHKGKTLCEDCCINTRMPRSRKTHWQYLRSIKTEYLKPGKSGNI